MPESAANLDELLLSTSYPLSNLALTFLALLDTPDSYQGFARYFVAVKPDETGLEFVRLYTPPDEIDLFTYLVLPIEA